MFDPKRWAIFAFLKALIHGKLGLLKGMILIPLLIFFFFLLPLYITIKLIEAVTRYLFVRGDGRQIWSGFRPNIRQTTIRRGAARGIDFLIVGLVVIVTSSLIQIPISNASLGIGLSVLYFVGSVHVSETTPGKSIMGLKIVTATGGRLTPYQSVVRELTSVLSIYILPIALYVVMKNKNEEQIGDVISDTRVVKSQPSGLKGLNSLMTDVLHSITNIKTRNVSTPTSVSEGNEGTILQNGETNGQSTIMQGGSGGSKSSTQTVKKKDKGNHESGHGTLVFQNTSMSTASKNNESTARGSGSTDSTCSNCGEQVAQGSYCPNCGNKLL